jgi:hypothetical protein
MLETPEEMDRLQQLLDRIAAEKMFTFAAAG